MNRKSVTCLITALLSFVLTAQIMGADPKPGDNPVQFRNSLHRDYSNRGLLRPVANDIFQPSSFDYYEKTTLTFEDLIISESVGPANFLQEKADIAVLKGGRTAVIWEDNRFGPVGIYLQFFDDNGNTIENNRMLNQALEFDILDPRITADTSGCFYFIWRKETDGFLRARRFDSLANPISPVFSISDTTAAGYAGEYDVACLPDGRLIVVWEDYSEGNDVAFQIFTAGGAPSTQKTLANSDDLDVRHWSPVVAVDNSGDFALVWEDYRGGSADIFFRRFSTFGIPYTSEFSLADVTAPDSSRFLPSLAFSVNDGYTAAWVDLRDGQNIYMQRVTKSGVAEGDNLLLTSQSSDLPNWEVALDVNSSSNLLAVWTIYGGDKKIMLQRFSSGVQIDGMPLAVSTVDENLKYDPVVAGNNSGNTGIFWTDLIMGSGDIYGAVYDSDGGNIRSAFMVNDDTTGSPSIEPQVVSLDQYEWVTVFTDMRRDDGDIMLQRVYVGGDLIGPNRIINGDAPGGYQSQPAVSAGDGNLLISWTDDREGGVEGRNIFCIFSRPHYNLTDEIVVNNDSQGSDAHYDSDCAINGESVSLVVWTDTRHGSPRIFGQLFDQNFQKFGTNFQIGPENPSETGEMPVVLADVNGNFIVSYLNRLNTGGPAVEIKQITAAGVISSLFEFSSDHNGFQIDGFDAGVNPNDQVVLTWRGLGVGEYDLYMTVIDYAGSIVRASSSILTYADALPGSPSISVDELGYVVVTWLEYNRAPNMPLFQTFTDDWSPLHSNLPVSSDVTIHFAQSPAAACNRGRSIFVWSDARANGSNIYASQQIYEPTDVDDNTNPMPAEFDLSQNYPNPFNPSTVIQFSLPGTGHIRMEVLNLLGQKVRTLIDRNFPAGAHNVIWDGTADDGQKVSSGVYLYRLVSEEGSRTRKMTLVK